MQSRRSRAELTHSDVVNAGRIPPNTVCCSQNPLTGHDDRSADVDVMFGQQSLNMEAASPSQFKLSSTSSHCAFTHLPGTVSFGADLPVNNPRGKVHQWSSTGDGI